MLTALAMATPIFGLALTPPASGALAFGPPALVEPALLIAEGEGAMGSTTREGPSDAEGLGEALRRRQSLAGLHRALGIATWVAMAATVVLGVLQYYNLYGFFGGQEDTPCVRGDAIFGQDQCWGTPWPHRIAALGTTVLYTATFAVSLLMPDPMDLSSQESDHAREVRIHKALRWVHLVGMILQIGLGFATGQNWLGLDRANEFGAMQALATVHQAIGLVTFGTLTAAGLLMLL